MIQPVPNEFDILQFIKIVHMMSKLVYHLFAKFNEANREMIEDGWDRLKFKNGLDIYKWMRKMIPIRNTTTSQSKIYVWDVKGEKSVVIENSCKPNMTDKEIIELVKSKL